LVTLVEALAVGAVTLSVAAIMAWWVLRPFERQRRQRRHSHHAAE
jgi:hypothetical protein